MDSQEKLFTEKKKIITNFIFSGNDDRFERKIIAKKREQPK